MEGYEVCNKLRTSLKGSMDSYAILLSGGLDSSILALLNDKLEVAITIAYNDAPDLDYAKSIANRKGIKHVINRLDDSKALEYAKEIVRIMHTFDPMEVRNSIVIYASMLDAKEQGYRSIITGDGADELFAGYNYLLKYDYDRLKQELERLMSIMHFSSFEIGKELKVRVNAPYLDDDIINIAKSIPIELKVNEYNGVRYGKWILRICFKELLGYDIAFRSKMAMEQGSGLSRLNILLENKVDDLYYAKAVKECKKEGVRIRSKEHLYYYNIFKQLYGIPKEVYDSNYRCPDCLASVKPNARFCNTCGAFPIKPMHTS